MEEIVRNPYNEYIDFHATMKHVGGIPGKRSGCNILFVEEIGYRRRRCRRWSGRGLPVVPMKPTA